MPAQSSRFFPTLSQVSTPEALERTLRQVLTQHYTLVDQHNALKAQVNSPDPPPKGKGFPPGSGPADSMICGLRVLPVDVQTLANGATLKWNAKAGLFYFG